MSAAHISGFRKWLFSSPPVEWAFGRLSDLLIGALRQGPVPRHVAFVMDGNRRFARDRRMEVIEGHNLGFETLARVLGICYRAGVETVTVYAFSIENFKRPKHEVQGLMDMAKLKLAQLAEHGEVLHRYGASLRFLGNLDMLPPDVKKVLEDAMEMTKDNTRAVLNICAPYTSRDEIARAVRKTVEDYAHPVADSPVPRRAFSEASIASHVQTAKSITESQKPVKKLTNGISHANGDHTHTNGNHSNNTTQDEEADTKLVRPVQSPQYPSSETVTSDTLTSHMYTNDSPPLDLLIRTSGVERLSDFMLWQCHEQTSIVFLKCLWPEFSLWQFLPVLVEWQYWRNRDSHSGLGVRDVQVDHIKVD